LWENKLEVLTIFSASISIAVTWYQINNKDLVSLTGNIFSAFTTILDSFK
jgi:hypothetical protein